MGIDLLVVGVEAAVADVVNAGRHAAGDHAGDEVEIPRQRGAVVADGGFVFGGEFEDGLRADAGVEGDAFEEGEISLAGDAAHLAARGHGDGAAVGGLVILMIRCGVRLVEVGEELFRLVLVAAAVDPAVELGRVEADAGVFQGSEALGLGFVEADADGGIGTRAGVVEIAAEPAGVGVVGGVGGFPDGGGDEVRAVRIRIADALDDAEVAFLEQRAEEGHRGVQADVVAELDDFLFLLGEARPGLVIGVIREGDERVEPVIAAGELEDD